MVSELFSPQLQDMASDVSPLYVCMYVCMYECMYVCSCTYIHTYSVRDMTGRSVIIDVDYSSPISTIQERIQQALHMPLQRQRIVWAGKLLAPELTFADYNINREATMHVRTLAPNSTTDPTHGFD
jgi:hypothetical protein